MLELAQAVDPELELKYNKFYIGLSRHGQAYNFLSFRPKKQFLVWEAKLPKSEEVDAMIEAADLETLEYDQRWGLYRIRLKAPDIKKHEETLCQLIKLAHDYRIG